MSQQKQKKKAPPEIPNVLAAKLTNTQRKELHKTQGAEIFEKTTPSPSPAASLRKKGSSSGRQQLGFPLFVKDVNEIEYQNEPLSAYEQTAGTASLESLTSIGSEKEKEVAKIATKYPQKDIEIQHLDETVLPSLKCAQPIKEIDDNAFCRGTKAETAFSCADVVDSFSFGNAEKIFCSQLIKEISELVLNNEREDLELVFQLTREENGLPRLNISLVPKCEQRTDRTVVSRLHYNKYQKELEIRALRDEIASGKELTEHRPGPSAFAPITNAIEALKNLFG